MGNFWLALLAISITTAQLCLYVFLSQTPAGAAQTIIQSKCLSVCKGFAFSN